MLNAFRIGNKKFCLTEWIENSYDFLELDTDGKSLSLKASEGFNEVENGSYNQAILVFVV